jgi:NTE family protein
MVGKARHFCDLFKIAGILCLFCLSCAPLTAKLDQRQFPDKGGNGPGYRFGNLDGGKEQNKLFVCLSLSGGGTRAAALTYGAMIALRQTRIEWPRNESLLDEVDCISSVSGGSFTAAYYGLFGDDLFLHFEQKFLYRNIQRALIMKALGPWNWPRLISPFYSRIDLAAELYDDQIFEHKTYQDLITQHRRPFIILNATNIGTGNRFPFTQDQFDLIGSDLGKYSIARAVAASSAFPFLLSPITVANYQTTFKGFPIPTTYKLGTLDYYSNRSRYYWSESEISYITKPEPYVHLMDGGLADNIGLRSIVNAYEQSNGFINRNLRDIDRLVIIAVNARTQSKDAVSGFRHTPHIIPSVAMATATISMDNYSFDTVDFTDRLMSELRKTESVSSASRKPSSFHAPIPYVIEIGFEAIQDKPVKDAFLNISTSFDLPAEQVKALINMGCTLLKNDPFFRCMLEDLERMRTGKNQLSACDEMEKTGTSFQPLAAERIVCPPAGDWPRVK